MSNHTLVALLCSSTKGKAGSHFAWTTLSRGAKGWWNSARGTVTRIEVLVGLVAVSMVLLTAIGSWRRRSRNFVAQKVVQVMYISSSSLAIYTFGSMQSSPTKSGMFPFLAMSLYVLSASADCITAYSLDDNRQLMTQAYQTLLSVFYVGLIASTILGGVSGVLGLLFFELSLFALLKWMQRQLACRMASGSWFLNKMVADYMYQQQEHTDTSFYDPTSMKGYHYLVDWPLLQWDLGADTFYALQVNKEEAAGAVISIENIWQCESLNSEQKDLCLSFSLFHLLRRRFFGFPCAESSRRKTLDFVLKGLLKNNQATSGTDYSRVFKVIQVELAFMYDFFFTKYAAIYYTLQVSLTVSVATSVVTLPVALFAMSAICPTTDPIVFAIRNGFPVTAADLLITVLMLACTVLLEFLQMLLYWTTIWGRVYLACRSVRQLTGQPAAPDTRRASCVRRFSDIQVKILLWIATSISNSCHYWLDQENICYWQNKLGQYSLLESVPYNPIKANKPSPSFLEILRALGRVLFLVNTVVISPARAEINRWRIDKPRAPIDLTEEVKEAVVQSLQRSQGILTNGESSLLSNGAGDLLWACRQEDMIHPADSGTSSSQKKDKLQVFVILTWHIATGYCEMATRNYLCPRVGTELKHHVDVATTLSQYCAYLLFKKPKLLPGHQYDTRLVFGEVAAEVVKSLQGEKNKYSAMARLPAGPGSGETKESIFHKGVRLGRQLEEMEEGKCWKVLAHFWAETLLYIAPSDNVEEHVKCLAKGGEFITHLWALLTHAGILDRGERNVRTNDIENQPGNHTAVQPAGMVQQQANLVHNVGGTPSASAAPTEIEEIQ